MVVRESDFGVRESTFVVKESDFVVRESKFGAWENDFVPTVLRFVAVVCTSALPVQRIQVVVGLRFPAFQGPESQSLTESYCA